MRILAGLAFICLFLAGTTAQAQSKKELLKRLEALEESNKILQEKIIAHEQALQALLEAEMQHNHAHPSIQPVSPISKVEEVASENATTIEFESEVFDFGQIQEGEVVEYAFNFTNTGDHPLIISNARGSCGCTVPEWPKEPIAPGEKGVIQVKFNSKGKKGLQNKMVTLSANTIPGDTRLKVTGEVLGKK